MYLHDRVEFWLEAVKVISLDLHVTHDAILESCGFLQSH